jgi:molecular chaperone DnaJ
MTPVRDPWVTLGVGRGSSDQEIKRAYRKLAMQYHPDHNPGNARAAERFQEIARAYKQIEDDESREQWLAEHEADDTVFRPLDEPTPQPRRRASFDDGRGSVPRTQSTPRRTTEHELSITFKQAFDGATMKLPFDVDEPCHTCGGSGAAPGYHPHTCAVCRGRGEHQSGRISSRCHACDGRGFTIDRPCEDCDGGLVRERRPMVVAIPAGVPDGHVLRVPQSRSRSEVLLTVHVQESKVFKRKLRDHADLLIDLPVSYSELALGAAIKLPTPDQTVVLKVPAGTPAGMALRLPGVGMPRLDDSGRGDLYARMQLRVPRELGEQEREVVRRLSGYDNDSDRARLLSAAADERAS